MVSTSYNTRLTELIRSAESGVQKVIADAAGNGDYDAIETARQVAIDLKALGEEISPTISDREDKDPPGLERKPEKRVAAVKPTEQAKMPSPMPLKSKGGSRSRPGRKPEYPRFEARNGVLYRIGWSKKGKKEYVHKVPRSSFDTILGLLGRIANDVDTPVPAESVIESLDDDARETIPTYQVYAVLMYLRQLDAIEQTGRDGYRIPRDIFKRKDTLWPS